MWRWVSGKLSPFYNPQVSQGAGQPGEGRTSQVSWGAMAAEFRLLGDVQARVDGRTIDIGHARQRCVLLVLLIDANRPVAVDCLVDRIWADTPPQRARATVHNYMSRLRRALAVASDVTISRGAGGYSIMVDRMAVDVHRFRHLVCEARGARDDAHAATLFAQAMQLWRGEAFSGLDTPWLSSARAALDQERWAAELDFNDVRLRLGEHGELIGPLSAAEARCPLDERVAGQLVLALYRSGRQAEAFTCYQQIRTRLADELGADPGPPLRRLYHQMLTADPALTAPVAGAGPTEATPAQLPPDVRGFVGRVAELRELDRLRHAMDESAAMVICVLSGTAGVGKTALAVHWAHRVADRFPDGQLYLDLRGFDPDEPVPTGDAAAALLRSLGVAGTDIPYELAERAAQFRSLMAGRRMLILLDNAHTAEQVRPLLPGSRSCFVLVTSRDRMAGLVVRHGAQRLDLDLLPSADAVGLLTTLIRARATADPDAAAALAERCARLPLALRVAAERAAARPMIGLAELVAELDGTSGIDVLDAGADERTAVRAVFSWSSRHLPADTCRTFRMIGLHPGRELDGYAAAALAGVSLQQARRDLDQLARAHLVMETRPGRFGMHDLLRAHAADLARQRDPDDDLRAALTRLFDHYRAAAAAAVTSLPRMKHQSIPAVPGSARPAPALHEASHGEAWLEVERANLLAVSAYAARHGWPAHTRHLAGTLCSYLAISGQLVDAFAIAQDALDAALDCQDRRAEADAQRSIAEVLYRWGRVREGLDRDRRALGLYREVGESTAEVRTVMNMAVFDFLTGNTQQALESMQHVLTMSGTGHDPAVEAEAKLVLGRLILELGRYDEAHEHLTHGLRIFRQLGDQIAEADALEFLGQLHMRRGRSGEAVGLLQQALAIYSRTGHRLWEAGTRNDLGVAYHRTGRHDEAYEMHRQALVTAVEIGDRRGEASALDNMGVIHHVRGNAIAALAHHQKALAIAREIGDRFLQTRTLNGLGQVLRGMRQPDEALTCHQEALAVSEKIGDRFQQARALDGTAHIMYAREQVEAGRRHRSEALAIYARLGVPEADQVPVGVDD
jgi:DNA-binding SARP family transcriptional activator/tetratricopeptide (TPR) repeat protein